MKTLRATPLSSIPSSIDYRSFRLMGRGLLRESGLIHTHCTKMQSSFKINRSRPQLISKWSSPKG